MTRKRQNRKDIRHPSDIPLVWKLGEVVIHDTEYLRNISEGGLAFVSHSPLPVGVDIDISIPIRRPEIHICGMVMWCRETDDGTFEVGVQFRDAETQFRMRMVEQVCHIEHFKKEMLEKEGRQLTGEQAAIEWVQRYAKNFP